MRRFSIRRTGKVIAVVALGAVALVVATLALPVQEWRTGDQHLMPLAYRAPTPLPANARRLWIDTDAACDADRTTDPDDCLAIALLLQSHAFDIAGVSTTFGNAAREVVDSTVSALLDQTRALGVRPVPHYAGAMRGMAESDTTSTVASDALAKALSAEPLVILALGPLTNIAHALRDREPLRARVVQLIAVMGRRPGHLFHPSAGAHARSFFGHGPVMRDFNYAMDPAAVQAILQTNIPVTLVPYDAAKAVEISAAELDRLAATGPAMRWATARSRQWLDYWTHDIGRQGFFPFDLVAAAYLLQPESFGCADVGARIDVDERLLVPPFRPRALLITRSPQHRRVEYCGQADSGLAEKTVALARGRKTGP